MMAIKFNPTGYLNLTTDPMDLPEQADQKNVVSGAMTRCKNLDLTYRGIAKTRLGSSLKNTTDCSEIINHLQVIGSDRYAFGGDQIFYNEASIVTGLTAAAWDSLIYQAYNDTDQAIFAVNGTNRKRIQAGAVYEWGIAAPAAAPTVTAYTDYTASFDWELNYITGTGFVFTAESGNYNTTYTWEIALIEGTPEFDDVNTFATTGMWEANDNTSTDKYQVKYTYARYDGALLICESNPSPAAETNLENYIAATWVVPSDSSVTHVRFYRTLANFGDFYYAGTFAIDSDYGVLGVDDEDLGSLVESDHDRPPAGTVVAGPDFNGVCFMAYGNLLYYSKAKQPEYWPALYNVECGNNNHDITALAILAGQLYAATNHEIYQISGTGAESFFPLPMAAVTGTHSKNVFLPVKGYGIFHLGYDGLYLYTGSSDIKISNTFASLWNNETAHGIPYINKSYLSNCQMIKYENKLWFGYPGSTSVYCDNWLTIELESNLLQGITGKIQYYTYPWIITAIKADPANQDILAVDYDGYVRKLDDLTHTTDDGTIISWEIESKAFGALRKYFPRWARYDVELVNGATAAGYVLLDDVSKQTHTISQSRNIKKRLIDGCTGDRLSIRLSGTGPVKFYSAEIE